MNGDKNENINQEDDQDFLEQFSESVESLEFRKEKRLYGLCIIFLPILITILILSIILYSVFKEPIKKGKENNDNYESELFNYTIRERIAVTQNDSKPVPLFNDHFTNLENNIISIKINNKTIKEIQNYYSFNRIGNYLVEITFNKKLESMQEIFNDCTDIVELDLSDISTNEVKSMKSAFNGCSKLVKINLDNFNTSSVTDMSNMFSGCHSLISLNLFNFNTTLVQDMSNMFQNCTRLKYINISSFNTKNVYKMNYMFNFCNLSSIDVSNFNTQKVVYMQYMFSHSGFLTSLNLSNFDTREVVDFSYLFEGNKYLTNIDISNFYTDKMNSFKDMFLGLPAKGTITFNLYKTSARILNQIPDGWKKIKYIEKWEIGLIDLKL